MSKTTGPKTRATIAEPKSTPSRIQGVVPAGKLCLVVIGEGLDATYPLPDRGRVAIGRAADSDIRIDHPSVSRNHAMLEIGDKLAIADLGSVNGTRLREALLALHMPTPLALGEPFDVGSVMIVVQQRSMPTQKRTIWAHGYFEARLDEECARAQRNNATFAVVRVHCSTPDTRRVVEDTLSTELRAMDVIGYSGPAEHEILIVDIAPDEVDATTKKLAAALTAAGVQSRLGVARFPTDARNPYELLDRASADALGQARVAGPLAGPAMVIANAAILNLDRIVQRIAGGQISVLVTGETGVGKEVLAERLHRLSRRADKPFLRLNCAALSESLLESELFGHEKGSFTGAVAAKAGLLETAEGGTVFLDEIGELPMTIQVKLLRVLEERQVLRVGALKTHTIDVRFLAATNRDLEVEIVRGTFRQDLYFRLNGITLVIPPLRERTGEIPDLAAGFLRQSAERNHIDGVPGITPAAMAMLRAYSWPGNIRELRNVMERALLLAGGTIDVEHLPLEKMQTGAPAPPTPIAPAPIAKPVVHEELEAPLETFSDERTRIIEALTRAGGNQTEAAKLLGYSRRKLIDRVIQFQIPRPRKKG